MFKRDRSRSNSNQTEGDFNEGPPLKRRSSLFLAQSLGPKIKSMIESIYWNLNDEEIKQADEDLIILLLN